MVSKSKNLVLFMLVPFLVVSYGCSQVNGISSGNIRIEFDQNMHSRVIASFENKSITIGSFDPSEFITVSGKNMGDFALKSQGSEEINDKTGKGKQVKLTGESGFLQKTVTATAYEDFPSMILFSVAYTNNGPEDLNIDGWTNNQYKISAGPAVDGNIFWSYQSGSYESRPDWVLPVNPGFKQQNYMGMNASDYGGGTPISDVWRKDVGIAVGHVETVPKLVSLPVTMPDDSGAVLGVRYDKPQVLKSGETLTTWTTFVSVHQGDYFATLETYHRIMDKRGVHIDPPQQSAYEPIWCAWGYRRDFNVPQVLNTLPEVKALGFKWAVLDDGWQTAEGDWYLVKDKFPAGDTDMKKFVDTIHSYGLKAKLWWAPLAVDPGTDLIKEHPDYLLLNKDGSKQLISWWDAYYLCPADPDVQKYTTDLVKKIMGEWGFDGLKIDGQHLNAAPPCYNPAHHHNYPEEAFEKLPEFFAAIYKTALEIKPDAVVEICPCGTACSFYNLPYMNQPVASDPESSWQIRLKGKTYKGLMGPSAPYYGDHVELSDGHDDFASTVGVGGVIGTKFTWPVVPEKPTKNRRGNVSLTPEKESEWKKWINIYQENMLPEGKYLGTLYDIGFDRPEAHAIQKDNKMYYAFYADEWNGKIELRGLKNQKYHVRDYVTGKDYGTVEGSSNRIDAGFSKFLLLEASPE